MMRGRAAVRGRGVVRGRGRSHRPRTGRHGGSDTELDRRFYADGSAVSVATDAADVASPDVPAVAASADVAPASSSSVPQQQQQQQQQQQRDVKKAPKPTSDFTLLHSALSDAESIAEYVRTYHSKRFAVAKQFNTFLQAISCRPDAVYDELTRRYKSEVVLVLDRLYSHLSLGKVACTPAAHEFVLRCEACGVRRGEWAGSGASLPAVPGAEPSLFTPRELLKKLASCDPLGRLQRMIEMARTVAELERCARKVTALFARDATTQHESEKAAEDDGGATARQAKSADKTSNNNNRAVPHAATAPGTPELSYATRCQLVSKLLSKARRIATLTHDEDKKDSEATTQETCTTAVNGDEDEEKEPSQATAHEVTLGEDDRAAFTTLVTHLIDLVQAVLQARPASTTQQPIAKCVHFARWCAARRLIADTDLDRVASLEAEAQKDMQTQATQLETVMRLKALQQSGDVDALTSMLEELWQAGAGRHFRPFSADVLSAIATAAAADAVPQSVKETAVARLVQTQQSLRDHGVELPRRALKFIQTVRSAQKAAAVAAKAIDNASRDMQRDDE